MSIKINNCNLCESTNIKHFLYVDYPDYPFNVSICNDCGLIFMNPRFSQKTLDDFYSEEYYKGNAIYSWIDERKNSDGAKIVWNKRIEKMLDYLNITDGNNKNFLDIGCSFGGLLKCAETYGFTPFGVDVSGYATEYAKKQLHLNNIICNQFKKGLYENNFFDIITMIEVIEHLPDPMQTLKEIHRILKKGGVLLVQTANMDGQQAKKLGAKYHYYVPGHIHYFTKKTLKEYSEKIGFSEFKCFYGVEFGLLPKLKKSGKTFKKLKDYLKWLRIIWYHLKSQIHFRDFALTSSMVCYLKK